MPLKDEHKAGGMPLQPSLNDLIQVSMHAEREAYYLYEGMAGIFVHLPEIAAFWQEMAGDEEVHLDIVDSIRALLPEDTLVSPVDPVMFRKVSGFMRFKADDVLKDINSLDDAYRFSVNFEFSEINKLIELLIDSHIEDTSKRKRLSEMVAEHQGKLKSFAAKFGDAALRREITPRR